MSYIDKSQIESIKESKSIFNTDHLVNILEEINRCYGNECYIACGILIRALLDHIPPLFEKKNIEEVVNNYSWDRSSERSSRKIVKTLYEKISFFELNIHKQISKKVLNINQDEYDLPDTTSLKLLLNEVIFLLRGQIGTKTPERKYQDSMFPDAVRVVVNAGRGSASVLQSKLRIGYARSAGLLKS
jgi:DNA segregation ATPase FtsK/SpoIIIE-like protein